MITGLVRGADRHKNWIGSVTEMRNGCNIGICSRISNELQKDWKYTPITSRFSTISSSWCWSSTGSSSIVSSTTFSTKLDSGSFGTSTSIWELLTTAPWVGNSVVLVTVMQRVGWIRLELKWSATRPLACEGARRAMWCRVLLSLAVQLQVNKVEASRVGVVRLGSSNWWTAVVWVCALLARGSEWPRRTPFAPPGCKEAVSYLEMAPPCSHGEEWLSTSGVCLPALRG